MGPPLRGAQPQPRAVRHPVRGALADVAVNRAGRVVAEPDNALLAALAGHQHLAALQVDVGELQPGQPGQPHAGLAER